MTTAIEPRSNVRRPLRPPVTRKERASQLPWALGLFALIVAAGVYIVRAGGSPKLGFIWVVGVALGLALQRSRFCFTAAMRDPVLTGSTSLTKAVVAGLAVGTVGFSAIQLGAYFKAGQLADAAKLAALEPVGLHTVVGGALFGAGAVIAGGCASGTLMRMGEGFLQQWLVLPFFVLGSALGAVTWPVWKAALRVAPSGGVWLPAALGGFLPALLVQFGLLLAVWLLADWWGRRHAS
ncbi:MAG TPA: YeeE/YedE thiosulfate transporter family protein [Anaeromyxobacteraceae bacterium]|nr:YeeE/YedE thiosulfate transporter family protein [Anaeromyxobacteraceae bacterium]